MVIDDVTVVHNVQPKWLLTVTAVVPLIIILSLCAFCFKLFEKVRGKGDWEVVEQSDIGLAGLMQEDGRRHKKRSTRGAVIKRKMDEGLGIVATKLAYVQPPQVNVNEGSTRLEINNSVLCDAQPIEIQPAYDDHMAYEMIRNGRVMLPASIPEAPLSDKREELGIVHYSVSYDVFNSKLMVLINRALNLEAKDLFGTSDPYVRVQLVPSHGLHFETRVKRKNLNPIWNQLFAFEGFPHNVLMEKKLFIQVFDHDVFTRDDIIGEILHPIKDIPLHKEQVSFQTELSPSSHHDGWLGDLLVSLCYRPSDGRLTIIVMKCVKLKAMDVTGKSDPYVKVSLLDCGRRVQKKRTTVKFKSLNPVFNELIVFDIPFNRIRNMSYRFTVMDHNKVFPNKRIGRVTIGPRATGIANKHWTDMMNSPRKAVAMWHKVVKK